MLHAGGAVFPTRRYSPPCQIGPGGKSILPAGYEGFSKGSWSEIVKTAPMAARYMDALYRTYGMYNVAIGLMGSAIAVTAFRRGERWA